MTPKKLPENLSANERSGMDHSNPSCQTSPPAFDRVLSVVGHELRNPIAAIVMAAEALRQLCADAPDKKAMSDVIYRQARQANRLLDDLLDVARMATGGVALHKQRMDLIGQVQAVLQGRKAQLDSKHPPIHVELPDEAIWVDADAGRLCQAVENVIDSGIELADRYGGVAVVVRSTVDGALVEIRANGPGLEPAEMESIFEPFAVAHGHSQHGSSRVRLGLALAKGIVELHGGNVVAQSPGVDGGFVIRVLLPTCTAPFGPLVADGPATEARRSLHILIVEDSPDVVTSLQFLLKAAGHELSTAAGGAEGIETARRLRPDVVLCDIGLPDIDGYAVAKALRADPATAESFLIAVSGYGSDEDQRRSLAAGFNLHLNKPEGFVGLNERLAALPIGRR